MSQLTVGTVIVRNGQTLVKGIGVDWTTVSVGQMFLILGDQTWYSVASVTPPSTSSSHLWEIQLNRTYLGVNSDGALFAIVTSYSPLYGFLIVNQGDVRTDLVQQRNIQILETLLAGLGAGGVAQQLILSKTITGALIGQKTIPMTYPAPLSLRPVYIAPPVIEKTNAADDDIIALTIDSITTSGFNVNLSAGAVNGTTIRVLYIPAS